MGVGLSSKANPQILYDPRLVLRQSSHLLRTSDYKLLVHQL